MLGSFFLTTLVLVDGSAIANMFAVKFHPLWLLSLKNKCGSLLLGGRHFKNLDRFECRERARNFLNPQSTELTGSCWKTFPITTKNIHLLVRTL